VFCATAASECNGDALGAEAQRRGDGKERAGRLGAQRQQGRPAPQSLTQGLYLFLSSSPPRVLCIAANSNAAAVPWS
jgi:hypothetical protein